MTSDQQSSLAPSPQTTLLIILGASEWSHDTEYRPDEAFKHAAKGLETYFVDSFGIPKSHILQLFNTDYNAIDMLEKIYEHIGKFKQIAKDVIIYYVGHAERTQKHHELYFPIKSTRTFDREGTSLKIESLAKTVYIQARNLRRFYILDCCFSARALDHLQGVKEADLLAPLFEEVHETEEVYEIFGYLALLSSGKFDVSVILPNHTNTFFTQALLLVLTSDNSSKPLSFRYVHKQINSRLPKLYKQHPDVGHPPEAVIFASGAGDIADLPIFPNPFRFHNGETASTVEDLLRLCEQMPKDGIYYLMQGHFEKWLISVGRDDLAKNAQEARSAPELENEQQRFFRFIAYSKIMNYFYASHDRRFTFLLVGKTGVGKSSTINTLLGKKVAEVGDIEPVTAEVKSYEIDIQGIPCRVVDTPGLCDGKNLDDTYVAQMCDAVGENGVDCLWFVTPLSDMRLRPEETQAINAITQAFGQEIWKRAVVVLTFADHLSSRPEKYRDQLNNRPIMIRKAIVGTQSSDKNGIDADEIPFVAITNEGETTPDSQRWLALLYLATIERISSKGFGAFFLATQARLQMREEKSDLIRLASTSNTDHRDTPPPTSQPERGKEEKSDLIRLASTSNTDHRDTPPPTSQPERNGPVQRGKSVSIEWTSETVDTSPLIVLDQVDQQKRLEEAAEHHIEKATGLQGIFKAISEILKRVVASGLISWLISLVIPKGASESRDQADKE